MEIRQARGKRIHQLKQIPISSSSSRLEKPVVKSSTADSWLFSDAFSSYHKPILILLCAVCYGITLNGDFVFDDAEGIVNNRIVRNGEFFQLWRSDFWGHPIDDPRSHKSYRPLTSLTFMLEHAIFGLQPLPYHLINVVLHTIVTLLVYTSIDKILSKFEIWNLKFLITLTFAVHPIHTEAVCNLVGRAELLMSIFFLLGLQKFMKILDRPTNSVDWIRFFFFSLCSMLSKEQGVMIFPTCMLMNIIETYQTKGKLKKNLNRVFLCGIGFGAFVWLRLWINGFENPKFSPMDNPSAFHPSVLCRTINYMYIWLYNFWLLLLPSQLCFDYSMGCIHRIENFYDYRIVFLLTIPGLLITGFYLVKIFSSQETNILIFSIGFMLITFLPASNLLATVGFVIAERVLYLPSLGFCILLSMFWKKLEKHYKNFHTFIFILLAIMAAKCIERSKEWNDELKLYVSALKVCPNNAKVHYNIAKVLANRGEFESAEDEYSNAIILNPSYEQALNNLALLFEKRGLFEKSEELLTNSLSVMPDFATAWMNLGIVQMKLEKFNKSEISFYESLRRRPKHADTLFNLGNLYLKQNRLIDAKNCWYNATSLDPKHLGAWINLFILLEDQDECATLEFLTPIAFEHHPHSPELYSQYGLCLAKDGRFEKAKDFLKKSIDFAPGNSMFWGNLGTLYHRKMEYDSAKESYEQSLALDENNSVIKENYAKLLYDIKKI